MATQYLDRRGRPFSSAQMAGASNVGEAMAKLALTHFKRIQQTPNRVLHTSDLLAVAAWIVGYPIELEEIIQDYLADLAKEKKDA
jgi:hypothetical protein